MRVLEESDRGPGRRRRVRRTGAGRLRAMTVAVVACLLVSCSTAGTGDREADAEQKVTAPTARGQTVTGSPSPTGEAGPARELPTVPARDPGTLARQLDRVGAVLRRRDARAADVRRAAEFQQLAVRALGTAPTGFRREVITRLHPHTARLTRGEVRAASLLHGMTDPQPRLPRWRIVAPAPPRELLGHYKRAQRRIGVPWTYLAAIHLVETRMGRIRGTSTAGAKGPMQFLPSTWELYGAGGDINDHRDAILAAARLLKANGAPADMANALWHYNPSDSYVGAVQEYARNMQRSPSAYRGYWHWRVLYRHVRGTHVLPVGYPEARPLRLPGG